jgi:hypothetical protein
MKNRGFKLKHDYSRDPRSCYIWQSLGFYAFSIFELFRFSEPVEKLAKGLCQTTVASAIQSQLFAAPTNDIFPEGYEKMKIAQFYYANNFETTNVHEYVRYMTLAADQSHHNAQCSLGRFYLTRKDFVNHAKGFPLLLSAWKNSYVEDRNYAREIKENLRDYLETNLEEDAAVT